MNWYIAKLVFQIVNKSTKLQFEEQWRLIMAEDMNEVFLKAKILAKQSEDKFLDNHNQWVHWKFKAITVLSQIEHLSDGIELSSSIVEMRESDHYLERIQLKQKALLSKQIFVNSSMS
jgi:hypothetical protein